MQPREWRLRIKDMIEAIEKIQKYMGSMDSKQFLADDKTFDAVIRNFEILGEAARFVPSEIQDQRLTLFHRPVSKSTE